jgi:hypothetical protein
MPDNGITEEVLQESNCCVISMDGHPTLLKLAIPFIAFQQSNELALKILIIFCRNCLFNFFAPVTKFRQTLFVED